MSESRPTALLRGLGPWAAASLVVGTIIGTGVFRKSEAMAAVGGSSAWVMLAWAAAGMLSFAGAMTYAELGGMFPSAGGEYVYLRRGYGPGTGYLFAWNRFWIATPASIASYAVGATSFIAEVVPVNDYAVGFGVADVSLSGVVSVGFIALFTAANCLNVRAGGNLQTVMTGLKVLMIGGLVLGVMFAPHGSAGDLDSGTGAFPGASAFGAMMISALWAYDGWNNLPMAAGEVRDPQRNVPRAILYGSLGVLAIYLAINAAYFYALPYDDVASWDRVKYPGAEVVAVRAATQFFGDFARALLGVMMAVSALSAMSGSMLTGARVPFAVARDRLAPAWLARLSPSRVPVNAVLVQGTIAVGLAFTGKFDDLTDTVVFSSWIFYALNAGSVIRLRLREPNLPRPYRVPGFPVVPIVFILVSAWLLANTVYTKPLLSTIGLGVTLLGATVYVLFLRGRAGPVVTDD